MIMDRSSVGLKHFQQEAITTQSVRRVLRDGEKIASAYVR